jgi:DNA invertase Pin-like site-specific DNA recombinase
VDNNSAVLWVRVSSVEQEKGYSLDSQDRNLTALAEKKGLRIVKKFRVTESAKRSDSRTQFKSLVTYIKEHEISHLVALEVSRLARNYEDSATIQALIDRSGLTIILGDGEKTISRDSETGDRFLFQIQGLLAENDNRVRGKKTRQGMLENPVRGCAPALRPWGTSIAPTRRTRRAGRELSFSIRIGMNWLKG